MAKFGVRCASTAIRCRRNRWRGLWGLLLVGMLLSSQLYCPVAAQDTPEAQFYYLLNRARLSAGLPPLGQSTLLQQAAQRHVQDMMANGVSSHTGSDGSDHRQRIRAAGYRAWEDGLMVDEALWIGLGDAADAIAWLLNDAAYGPLLADRRYREIGVAYASDIQGVHYFVATFGARPGVLPIFVNDGVAVTDLPQVAVRLTNEEAIPLGEGAWMGKAIEVRLNTSPDFAGILWQPWEPLLPWTLGEAPGEYAIYAEFRDGANRTAVAEAIVRLVAPGEAPATPTPGAAIVFKPALVATSTPGGAVAATPLPAETPLPVETRVAVGATGTPLPTWTPLPLEDLEEREPQSTDWALWIALALQALALLLGVAVFLRRR
ncbi:MAG TPA: CAP domain-containing protein [Anaerolineae bacterium]|nr:CAP domain-containing protein [Anaerolineae bacterium]